MKKITVSILTTLLMLSMVFSSSVFAANEKVSAWDSFLGLFGVKATETSDVGVEYRGHVENKGDFPVDGTWIQGPDRLGTVGEGLRLEAFWIKLAEDAPEGLHIEYQVHVQNKGWMGFVNDGAMAGTEAEGLRIEAIEIALVDDEGDVAEGYSVEYRGHVQNIGDTAWYADGDQLGTTGSGLRLEALEIKIVQLEADLTAYNEAVAAAEAVDETDYTTESYAALVQALEDNVVTVDNTQAEVDAATAAINAAIDALVMVTRITAVEATSPTTAVATFNQAVTSLDKAAVTVTDEDGDKQYIKTVELADDKLSATVTFFNNFVDETTYNIAIVFADGTSTGTFDYVVGEPATILLESQKVAKGGSVVYNVLDANGLDITSLYTVSVQTNAAANQFFAAPILGSVSLVANPNPTDFAFAVFSVTATDGTVVSSAQATITVNNVTPTTLGEFWTIDDAGTNRVLAATEYEEATFEPKTVVNMGTPEQLRVSVIDQFGDDVADDYADLQTAGYTLSYTSLDTSVAIVDTVSGAITPRKEGAGAARVTLTKTSDGTTVLTKTVEFNVLAAKKLSGITVEKDDETVTTATLNVDAGATAFDVIGVDQFGNSMNLNALTSATVTSSNTSVVTGAYGAGTTGTLTLTPVAAGSASVTVKYETFTYVVNVTVQKQGTIVGYVVDGSKTVINTKDDPATTTDDETEMTLGTYSIDSNGVKSVLPVEATYTVTDADAVVQDVVTDNVDDTATIEYSKTGGATLTVGDTYTVTVKVGTLTVATKTFTVVENGIAPAYSLKTNALLINLTDDDILKALTEVFDFGTATVDITGVSYASNNANVLDPSEVVYADQVKGDGTATIYIDTVTVDVTDVNPLKDGTFELDLNGEIMNVTVDQTIPVAQTATENGTAKVITLTFSEALDASTVVAANFTGTAGTPTVSYTAGSKTVTLTYADALVEDDTIIISDDVKDVAGNALVETTFTRGAGAAGAGTYTKQ